MERVITELANYYAANDMADVHLIKLTSGKNYFLLHKEIKLYEPSFCHVDFKPLKRSIITGKFLRSTVKKINPAAILSFGDRYNAFVILCTLGLGKKIFVSNRMNPFLTNGKAIDLFNKLLYPFAAGIIAQTNTGREAFLKKYWQKNIWAIGNPVRVVKKSSTVQQENIILNIGRFANEKNQELLLQYFKELSPTRWKLVFLGDGPRLKKVKALAESMQLCSSVLFEGNVSDIDIDIWYQRSKIFAFTSTSEGFPNALAEAMTVPLACISFNCATGPADLIEHGVDGFLIPNFQHDEYKQKLQQLINDDALRQRLSCAAEQSVAQFSIDNIGKKFLRFIFTSE